MRMLRIFLVLGLAFWLSIARAYAIQIDLSSESIDRYFQILEHYVLPLMVVSTIVLFCGYLASRIFHRTLSRREDDEVGRFGQPNSADDGTEAFLRGLKASPPIEDADTEARLEPKVRRTHPLLRRRREANAEERRVEREPTPGIPAADPIATAPESTDVGAEMATARMPKTPARSEVFANEPANQANEKPKEPKAQDNEPEEPGRKGEDPQTAAEMPPKRVPLLKAAFRRPRQKTDEAELPLDPAPVQARPVEPANTAPPPEDFGFPAEKDALAASARKNSNGEDTVCDDSGHEEPLHGESVGESPEASIEPEASVEEAPFENTVRDVTGRETADTAPESFRIETLRPNESAGTERHPNHSQRQEPTLSSTAGAPDGTAERRRQEPTISVVQSLKSRPTSSVAPAVKARAGEVIDSLDYIASILQQGSVLLAERLKKKQRLDLEDVRRLRVSGYDEPDHVLEDLGKLGGDAAEEVLSAFAAVTAFNNVVGRLEQMAETEPLDEGWNELIRSRISETIFTVGQVRKTLGIYRRATKRPTQSGPTQECDAAVPEPDGSVPIGRRQI